MAAKIAVQTQLASIRKTGEQTKANTDELLQRAQGKLPEKRPDQTAAERKRELDQALACCRKLIFFDFYRFFFVFL